MWLKTPYTWFSFNKKFPKGPEKSQEVRRKKCNKIAKQCPKGQKKVKKAWFYSFSDNIHKGRESWCLLYAGFVDTGWTQSRAPRAFLSSILSVSAGLGEPCPDQLRIPHCHVCHGVTRNRCLLAAVIDPCIGDIYGQRHRGPWPPPPTAIVSPRAGVWYCARALGAYLYHVCHSVTQCLVLY